MDSWVHFVAELQSTFGPHDPIADAEHQLKHLQMKDAHCCHTPNRFGTVNMEDNVNIR